MGIIAWIVVGAIAGWIASRVMHTNEGLLMMIGLGIVGGLVGGWLAANVFKMGSLDGISIESIVIATLGAILVLFVANMVNGKGRLGSRAT